MQLIVPVTHHRSPARFQLFFNFTSAKTETIIHFIFFYIFRFIKLFKSNITASFFFFDNKKVSLYLTLVIIKMLCV
jgi:hypothetical protein